jgi:isochorismate synthase
VRLSAAVAALDARLAEAAERLAARRGVLHATDRSLHAGFGQLRPVPMGPLARLEFPSSALEQLSALDAPLDAPVRPRCHLALPFDPREQAAVVLPEYQVTIEGDQAWLLVLGDTHEDLTEKLSLGQDLLAGVRPADRRPVTVSELVEEPSAARYAAAVEAAVSLIHEGKLEKVVLARSITLNAEQPFDPAAVAERMAEREPTCTRYAFPLSGGGRLVGASPELLLSSRSGTVTSQPLAGTLAIEAADDDPASLLRSAKDLDEHRILVEDLAGSLGPLLAEITVPDGPSIVVLRSVAHLGTLIQGRLAEGGAQREPLALLQAMLPTPAVGGVPRTRSIEVITELEGPRRDYFAGGLGWFDAAGDGEFVLGIRGAALRGQNCRISAGAGIVADSDPLDEARETRSKLASVLETVAPARSSLLSRP